MILNEYGADAPFELTELPQPSAGPGQLLLRVAASSVNTVDTWDTAPTPAARETLLAAAGRLLPALQTATVTDHWAGLRPMGRRGVPLIQPLDERITLAAGHHKIGLCLSVGIGGLVVERVKELSY